MHSARIYVLNSTFELILSPQFAQKPKKSATESVLILTENRKIPITYTRSIINIYISFMETKQHKNPDATHKKPNQNQSINAILLF